MQNIRKISISICLFILFSSLIFAEGNTTKSMKKKAMDKTESKIIIGATENIQIEPPGITFSARIDTGAKTTSIDARNIVPFERDGKRWVKFSIFEGVEEHKIERPVFDTVLIKRHGEESQRRFMVKMRVTFAEVSQLIRVSLTNRSSYEFPILIGRNFLKDYFIVDVSKNNIEKYAKPLGKEVKDEKK